MLLAAAFAAGRLATRLSVCCLSVATDFSRLARTNGSAARPSIFPAMPPPNSYSMSKVTAVASPLVLNAHFPDCLKPSRDTHAMTRSVAHSVMSTTEVSVLGPARMPTANCAPLPWVTLPVGCHLDRSFMYLVVLR